MLRYLASGLLTRSASRRLGRIIPNPIVRTVAVAAAAYGIQRLMTRRSVRLPRVRMPSMPSMPSMRMPHLGHG
jgi:hypothetical protein